jgi:hypothetical protein
LSRDTFNSGKHVRRSVMRQIILLIGGAKQLMRQLCPVFARISTQFNRTIYSSDPNHPPGQGPGLASESASRRQLIDIFTILD